MINLAARFAIVLLALLAATTTIVVAAHLQPLLTLAVIFCGVAALLTWSLK